MIQSNIKNPIHDFQNGDRFSDPYFHDNLMFGYFFKAIAASLLESCGYTTYPYGYETFFPNLKGKLNSISGETAKRIRSTPDLLVMNQTEPSMELVEVKGRNTSFNQEFKIRDVERYQKYWPESIMILVLPSGECFYAQHVSKLQVKNIYTQNDFCLFEELFPLAKELSQEYKNKIERKVKALWRARNQSDL
jgi:hypothetical protein